MDGVVVDSMLKWHKGGAGFLSSCAENRHS